MLKKTLGLFVVASLLTGCGSESVDVNLNNFTQKNIQQLKSKGYKTKTNVFVLKQGAIEHLTRFDSAADKVDNYLTDISSGELGIDPELFGKPFAGSYRYLEDQKKSYIRAVIHQQELDFAVMKSARDVFAKNRDMLKPVVSDYADKLDPILKKKGEIEKQIDEKELELKSINSEAYKLVSKYAEKNNIDVHIENRSSRLLSQGGFYEGQCKNKQYSDTGFVFYAVDVDIEHFGCYYLRLPEQLSGLLKGVNSRKFLEDKVSQYAMLNFEINGSAKVRPRDLKFIPLTSQYNIQVSLYNKTNNNLIDKYNTSRKEAILDLEDIDKKIANMDAELIESASLIHHSRKEGFKSDTETDIANAYESMSNIYKDKYESVLGNQFTKVATYPNIVFNLDSKLYPESSILFFERIVYNDKTTAMRDVWIVNDGKLSELDGNLSSVKPTFKARNSKAKESAVYSYVESLSQ